MHTASRHPEGQGIMNFTEFFPAYKPQAWSLADHIQERAHGAMHWKTISKPSIIKESLHVENGKFTIIVTRNRQSVKLYGRYFRDHIHSPVADDLERAPIKSVDITRAYPYVNDNYVDEGRKASDFSGFEEWIRELLILEDLKGGVPAAA